MPDDRMLKIFQGRPRGKPRKAWLDDLEEDLKRLGIQRWRQKAEDRREQRKIEETQALQR